MSSRLDFQFILFPHNYKPVFVPMSNCKYSPFFKLLPTLAFRFWIVCFRNLQISGELQISNFIL